MISTPAPRVFVSYSRDSPAHVERVLALTQQLRADGVDAWIDRFELAPGQGWLPWVRGQLERADIVVFVYTQTSEQRAWQRMELKFALESKNTKVIPVCFDAAFANAVPPPLRGISAVVLPAGYPQLLGVLSPVRRLPLAPRTPEVPSAVDWLRRFNHDMEAVTTQDILDVAQRYYKPGNSVVLYYMPNN